MSAAAFDPLMDATQGYDSVCAGCYEAIWAQVVADASAWLPPGTRYEIVGENPDFGRSVRLYWYYSPRFTQEADWVQDNCLPWDEVHDAIFTGQGVMARRITSTTAP